MQTNMWGRYHIDDPDDFYNEQPTRGTSPRTPARGTGRRDRADHRPTPTRRCPPSPTSRIDPYYLLMRLPGEEEQAFMILRPFVPTPSDDNQQMTAFMVAKSDPDDYGELETFVMPRNNLPPVPTSWRAR